MKIKEKAAEESKDSKFYGRVVSCYNELGGEQLPPDSMGDLMVTLAETVLWESPFVLSTNVVTGKQTGTITSMKYNHRALEELLVQPNRHSEIRGIQQAVEATQGLVITTATKNYAEFRIKFDDPPQDEESEKVFTAMALDNMPDALRSLDSAIKKIKNKRPIEKKKSPLEKVIVRLCSQYMGDYIFERDMLPTSRKLALMTLAGVRLVGEYSTPMIVSYRGPEFDRDGQQVEPVSFNVQPFYAPITGIYTTGGSSNLLDLLDSNGWPIKWYPRDNSPMIVIQRPWIHLTHGWDEQKKEYISPDSTQSQKIIDMLEKLPFDADVEGRHLTASFSSWGGYISSISIESDRPMDLTGFEKSGVKAEIEEDNVLKVTNIYTDPKTRVQQEVAYYLKNFRIRS